MALLIGSVLLFVLLVAGVFAAKTYVSGLVDDAKDEKERNKYLKTVNILNKSFFATPIAFLILLFGIFTTVGPNEVGIIFDQFNGGIQDETLGQGFHVKSLFQTITTINTSNEIRYVNTYGQSQDGNSVDYEVTLTIYISQENAGKFFRKTNSREISKAHLNTLVKEGIQKVSNKYEVFDIVGSKVEIIRSEIEEEVRELLINEYFITLAALTVEDVDVGPDIEKALERKAEEKLKLEIAQAEKTRAQVEVETELIKAENEAAIILLKAQANSEAQAILNSVAVTAIQNMYKNQFEDDTAKTEFENIGEGGYLTIQEISEIIIKQLYYDVWDGKLPTVITDGTDGIIIQP